MELTKGKVIRGNYVLETRIHPDKDTWAARRNDERYIVKIYEPTPEGCERYIRESTALLQINHPQVIKLLDMGFIVSDDTDGWDERPFIVVHYIYGRNLRHPLCFGSIGNCRSVKLVSRLCDAVHAVHAAGLVHRDIKPENVLIDVTDLNKKPGEADGVKVYNGVSNAFQSETGSRSDPLSAKDEDIVLIDFGLAIPQGTTGVHNDMVCGTPEYMSPEQARGECLGPCSDIYQLGVVLYECLTGRRPLDGPGYDETMMRHLTESVPDPRERNAKINWELADIVMRAGNINPHKRFQSAADIGVALQKVAL